LKFVRLNEESIFEHRSTDDRSMPVAHDVFISYSSEDKPIADAACAALESRKIRCWMSPRDVLPGIPYAEALSDALHGSRILVVVLSGKSNDSKHVMREVESAVNRGIHIVPFRIENVQLSGSMGYFLDSIHWLDAITPPLEKHLNTLAETIRVILVQQQRGAGVKPVCGPPQATDDERPRRIGIAQMPGQLYKCRKRYCLFLAVPLVCIFFVSLSLLMYRLAIAADSPVPALTFELLYVSFFCFTAAMPYVANICRLEECHKNSRSYEALRDCIGPFPTILGLEKLLFDVVPREGPTGVGKDRD
jgi:hypothetical protein